MADAWLRRSRRIVGRGIFLAVAIGAYAFGATPHPRDLLTWIKTPDDLLLKHFPRAYAANVKLSGAVADQIAIAVDSMALEKPSYIEHFDQSGRFRLYIANNEYTDETRELLAGILNPAEMIESVVESIIKYRKPRQFDELLRETTVAARDTVIGRTPATIIEMKPKKQRLAYEYEDLGAYVQESWLSGLNITIDTAAMVVLEVNMIKYSRRTDARQQSASKPNKSALRYVFSYDTSHGLTLPVALLLEVDGKPKLSIKAQYIWKNELLLFKERRICYHDKDSSSCLSISYESYRLNKDATVQNISTGKNKNKRLNKAAELGKRATEAMRKGKIEAAARIMRKLAEEYPASPQGVEARKMLEGLPGGW